jgi:hypothetical protein
LDAEFAEGVEDLWEIEKVLLVGELVEKMNSFPSGGI